MQDPKERFAFGENWENFIKTQFSEDRIDSAQRQLLKSLHIDTLEGRHFLDIGCGSGLHSLAAFRSGAKSVHSFDYDPNSVKSTMMLHEFAGKPDNWTVEQGSVLDKNFMKKLKPADIVYSWGVLHHTGHMWEAIRERGHSAQREWSLLYSSLQLHKLSEWFVGQHADSRGMARDQTGI